MPLILVGATGDLGRRKLVPALAALQEKGVLLPKLFFVGRRALSKQDIADVLCANVPGEQCVHFVNGVEYLQYDTSDPGLIEEVYRRHQDEWVTWYCALTPQAVRTLLENLVRCPATDRARTRIVVEKPFGVSGEDAASLQHMLSEGFSSDQLYRIDHYIAKETIEHMVALRTQNRLLARAWTGEDIAKIEIDFLEKEGVTHRTELYKSIGIVRDVLQNHLLVLLSAVCAPLSLTQTTSQQHQYIADFLRSLTAARQEESHTWADSDTGEMLIGVETTLYSQDQVWKNVPFVLRAAKNAAESTVRVQVYFRGDLCERVSFELQPTERATITLFAQTTDTPEEVSFVVTFPEQRFPDAYERLLADIVSWEKRFAMPFDVVREGWRIVDPLLNPSLTSSHE